MDVSVRELKARLSEYLRRVQRGEEVRVTHRGRVIARMTAAVHPEPRQPGAEELARRLRRIPGLMPGRGGKPVGAPDPLPIRPGERQLSDIVLEQRD